MRKREPLANLPNLISLSRLGMAGLFVLLEGREQRLLLIVGAATTDFLDGYIARSRGTVTKWGALIDAIADRFFVFSAVGCLLFDHTLQTWQYAVFISRDFMTAVGFLTAKSIPWLRTVPFQSRSAGKVVTVFQVATLLAIYLVPSLVMPLLIAVGIISLYAIVDYTVALYHARAVIALLAIGLLANRAGAQDFAFNPTVQWQGRADVTQSGHGTAALVGGGANVPVGYYVRFGVDGAVGTVARGGSTAAAFRTDVTARFLFDPFAEQRVGWYAGGGMSALHEGADWQPYVMLVIGREGPNAGRWRTAVEAAVGGGVRLSVVLRRARMNGR